MEVNTIASTGSIDILNESMTAYDGREVWVCSTCGRLSPNKALDCPKCKAPPAKIFIPKVSLVLAWELLGLGIEMKFVPNPQTGVHELREI
jgi:DNA-directed RNA polymerase beta subunit